MSIKYNGFKISKGYKKAWVYHFDTGHRLNMTSSREPNKGIKKKERVVIIHAFLKEYCIKTPIVE